MINGSMDPEHMSESPKRVCSEPRYVSMPVIYYTACRDEDLQCRM
jgi:hypothetical protein